MRSIAWAALAALAAAGCASPMHQDAGTPAASPAAPPAASPAAPPDVPATLQPPAGQEAYARFSAKGVQIYECAAKADAPDTFAWQFRAPEARLTDAAGLVVRHGAGPSWTAPDGSRIVGKVTANSPSPRAGAIPWLLLAVVSHEGQGLFDAAASVQRIDTAGGTAPGLPCGAGEAGQVVRVPYVATYVFWRARAG
jgi:hypothetical protein